MTHKNTTLAITAIVVAVAMTAAALAIPHQALAANHNHYHGSSSIGVSQNSTQLNAGCSNSATCVNSVSIHR